MCATTAFNMLKFNISLKILAANTFSVVLFIGCATFVSHRGYECFKKYLAEPEAVDMAYKFIGSEENSFPSFTFCPYLRFALNKQHNL